MKFALKSKTVWFNLLYLVLGVAALFGWGDFNPDANTVQLGMIINAIVNLYLRYVTNQPLTLKA